MSPDTSAPATEPLRVPDLEHADEASVAAGPAVDSDITTRLERLAALRRHGVLTEDEFDAAKAVLLQRPGIRDSLTRASSHAPAHQILPDVHPVDSALSLTAVVLKRVAGRLERHVAMSRMNRGHPEHVTQS